MPKDGFTHKGYHKGAPTEMQPQGSSPHINNMRPLDGADDRYRGGQRPGFDKWSDTRLSGAGKNPVVEMVTVTVVTAV